MAETQVGLAKYHLNCMSIDGCHGGFDRTQRDIFLDAKLKTALDRNEQKAVLQTVGIENLVHCPFCPFAMVSSRAIAVFLYGHPEIDSQVPGIPQY